ncbi:WRKY transcription factor SUSIBA2-like isoform X2 [Tasmannia lanceolata]|uniref:WRKY transcription factor SUSIBA2-like isoform X2 n=1 Tax=Tasmannia lanceolata TaxID=3420 RepID=UPI00406497BC
MEKETKKLAEPSPTTGTFSMPQITSDAVGSDKFSPARDTPNNSKCNEGSSGDFGFKPHIRPRTSSGLSSLGPLPSVSSSYSHCKPFAQVRGQCQPQEFASSPSVTTDNIGVSSHELTLSVTPSNTPAYMVTSMANPPSEVTSDESRQRQVSDNGTQASNKGHNPLVVVEKSSEDGYNWRKYGQKYVKGCEFPRSYYKCTHPNCQMKKQFERSHDGQIVDIIYKGQHDHPKPQTSRRLAVGAILTGPGEERTGGLSSVFSVEEKPSNAYAQTAHHIDSNGAPALSPVSVSDDDIEVACGPSNKIGDDVEDDDDPESKRRKKDIGSIDVTPMGKVTREPRVVVQTMSEVDILDDGYRWRKYGQKVVRGNPNPRSYYKCTNNGCPVRKHVERASHDPKAVITTYEGKHNHDVPSARTSSHNTSGPMVLNEANTLNDHMSAGLNCMLQTNDTTRAIPRHYDQSEENGVISLNLGVGISLSSENRSNEKQQTREKEQIQSQIQITGSSGCGKVIEATPIAAYYRSYKDGTNCYRSGEEQRESFSFNTPPLNHSSNSYRQNIGRLVLGP